MSGIFIKIFNLGMTAGWIVLAILLLRPLLKKVPKWINCLLWSIVGLRLILPIKLESIFSLIPSAEPLPENITVTQTPAINSGIGAINNAVNPIITDSFRPEIGTSVNPMQIIVDIAAYVWAVGIALILIYGVVSYIRLARRVRVSVKDRDNIYFCDDVDSPFILGVIRPRIYLPSGMSGEEMEYVIAHERAHLKRRDHIWKPLGFALLSVYWFNPLIWLAYVLLCRDIEMACDERVIKKMEPSAKKGYSEALLACSIHRRSIMACPLAFGEVGVKARIKSVLNYKKPAFWVIVIALVATLIVSICFLTNPKGDIKNILVSESDWYTNSGLTASFYVNDDGTIEGWMNTVEEIFNISLYYRRTLFGDAVAEIYRGTCSQVDAGEGELVIKGKLKKDGDSLVFKIDSNELGLQVDSLVFYQKNKEPLELGTLHRAYIAGAPAFIIRISDYGCDAENIDIELKDVIIDQQGIAFRILWHNLSESMYDISHDFKVYRYEGERLTELEQIEYNGYYVEEAVGWGVMPKSKSTREYRISWRYDISKSGNYRFECRGAWVDFEVMAINEAFMNLDASNGLDVIVWQMSQGSYSFALIPHSEENHEKLSYRNILSPGVNAAEMRYILSTYKVSEEDIHIVPWQNPISSYIADYWMRWTAMDDVTPQENMYYAMIYDMLFGASSRKYYPTVYESEHFDIDGDGEREINKVALGLDDGKFVFSYIVSEDGRTASYYDTFNSAPMSLKFFTSEGKLRLRGVDAGGGTHIYAISFESGHVKLTEIEDGATVVDTSGSMLDLSKADFSLVDRIVITNGRTGEVTYLSTAFNRNGFNSVMNALKTVKATNPVSNKGHYGFNYHVELYYDFQTVFSFSLCNEPTDAPRIVCGYYETDGGFDYAARYQLTGEAYAKLDAVLKNYVK